MSAEKYFSDWLAAPTENTVWKQRFKDFFPKEYVRIASADAAREWRADFIPYFEKLTKDFYEPNQVEAFVAIGRKDSHRLKQSLTNSDENFYEGFYQSTGMELLRCASKNGFREGSQEIWNRLLHNLPQAKLGYLISWAICTHQPREVLNKIMIQDIDQEWVRDNGVMLFLLACDHEHWDAAKLLQEKGIQILGCLQIVSATESDSIYSIVKFMTGCMDDIEPLREYLSPLEVKRKLLLWELREDLESQPSSEKVQRLLDVLKIPTGVYLASLKTPEDQSLLSIYRLILILLLEDKKDMLRHQSEKNQSRDQRSHEVRWHSINQWEILRKYLSEVLSCAGKSTREQVAFAERRPVFSNSVLVEDIRRLTQLLSSQNGQRRVLCQ